MPPYFSTLLLTLFIALAAAAPAPIHQNKGRSFKVTRVRNVAFAGYDGTAELVKAYGKWGMDLPSELAASLDTEAKYIALPGLTGSGHNFVDSPSTTVAEAIDTVLHAAATGSPNSGKNSTGSVSATPQPQDIEFLSPVQIGGQTVNMDFDTGSSDFWVFNTQLSPAAQAGRTDFDPTQSSTFQLMQGATFSIKYGDGSGAQGNVGTDTVNIGGATVTSQAVELATAVSGSFLKDRSNNGLVGLAFNKLNTVKPAQQQTFFDNAMPDLAEPVFTADLKASATGSYEFGRIDQSKFNGPLSWAPINTTNGFWQFSSSQFSINNGAPIITSGGQAIADTGTTLMLVNPVVVNAYYSQVNGAVNNATVGGITIPCSATLPDLQVDIGGNYMANVPGHLINFSKVDPAGKTCFGALQATTSGLQIYGDILFKSQFVVFNGGNTSIGMAPHN